MDARITLTPAQESDVPLILYFIRQLAEYERLASKVVATEAILRESLFGKQPKGEVVIARFAGEPAGFAVFFHNFSTFAGRAGITWKIYSWNPSSGGTASGRRCWRIWRS